MPRLIDLAGDLTKQKALRDSLHCKPFKWFMENIAFDQPLNYPPVEPPEYASGKIKNVAIDLMCLGAPKGNREGSRYVTCSCACYCHTPEIATPRLT